MADSSFSRLPLCERISYKSYFLRVVDLTILGLLLCLLFYRILYMNQNDSVWFVALLCESCFTFVWLLITCIKWSPADFKPYPERLDERVHELPSVDMFVTTADPIREPPMIVVNTVLSLLAVNYPANKLACYVSDDGCSPLTYFTLKEASKFAKIWVPFCKKYNVKVRAPFRYFLNPLDATEDPEFRREWEMTKREYEKLREKVEAATGDTHRFERDDDFEAFSNIKTNDHLTIVKVVWENKGGVGEEKEVPHVVYISREKRPNCLHHYKAGAMNFLYMGRGISGIQGPVYGGSGCFHTRRVMYGLSPHDLQHNGSLSPVAIRRLLTEESLTRDFGNSKEMVKSVIDAFQRKPNLQNTLTNSIGVATKMGQCNYENQTSWGKTIGWLYDSTAEDVNTSVGIHSRGWTSSYISPQPPAFLGCTPPGGPETMLQQRRWATGLLEILFNKQSPLIGMFSGKMRFRQSLAYLYVVTWGLRSIPELFYCLLPAYSLLHNSALFPKGICSGIVVTLVGIYCLYTVWEYMSLGFPVQSWYTSQSFGRIKTTSSWLFSIFDIIFKLLGISKTVFIVTKKTIPETKQESNDGRFQKEDDVQDSDSGKFEFDGSLYFLPGTVIMLVNLAGFSMGLQRLRDGGSNLTEVCGCILVVLLFRHFLRGLFEKGKYGIPLSTLSKAAFLAVLFVVFSVRK